MQLENRKALVTGAAGGIGQAIVARQQAEGAMLAASDLDLAASTANVLIFGDLRDTGYADGLANAAHDALGGLDIVVNKPASSPVALSLRQRTTIWQGRRRLIPTRPSGSAVRRSRFSRRAASTRY